MGMIYFVLQWEVFVAVPYRSREETPAEYTVLLHNILEVFLGILGVVLCTYVLGIRYIKILSKTAWKKQLIDENDTSFKTIFYEIPPYL